MKTIWRGWYLLQKRRSTSHSDLHRPYFRFARNCYSSRFALCPHVRPIDASMQGRNDVSKHLFIYDIPLMKLCLASRLRDCILKTSFQDSPLQNRAHLRDTHGPGLFVPAIPVAVSCWTRMTFCTAIGCHSVRRVRSRVATTNMPDATLVVPGVGLLGICIDTSDNWRT